MFSRSASALIASTAWPSAAPGARLNDSVIAGNCPWWLTESGSSVVVKCANELSGTWAPEGAGT